MGPLRALLAEGGAALEACAATATQAVDADACRRHVTQDPLAERGQNFTFHGCRFRVLRRERNRITALKITPLPREAQAEDPKPRRAGTAF